MRRAACQITELIETIQCGLDNARVGSFLDLRLQIVALSAAGDLHKRGQPVEGGEHLFVDRARLDVTRPADDTWRPIAALPRLALLTFEGGDPAIGEATVSAPLSVVNTTIVLSSWPICSSFASTRPMLSSSCFMPASWMPQSFPPVSPIMASYFGGSMVVTCMRAGLYHTKNGLPVFLGSLRSRKPMTLAEISSSTVRDLSSVSGP